MKNKMASLLSLMLFTCLLSCNKEEPGPDQSNIAFAISIQSQEDLDNTDFSLIDTIKGPLSIRNTSITDLNFLSDICVTGMVEIFGNESLLSLSGIENLSCVSALVIAQNANLRNIQALNDLEISDQLSIRNNGLEEIDPISSLSAIKGQIFIVEPNLKDYSMFSSLEETNALTLGGSLAENLDDLANLKVIQSEIVITGNQRLTDYCGLKNALLNSDQINFETLGNQINPTIIEVLEECN